METLEAIVEDNDGKHCIRILNDGSDIVITISEDKPLEVKNAFNQLLSKLKKGLFEIEFKSDGKDLFTEVAREYVLQLNKELLEVRSEMERYSLVD